MKDKLKKVLATALSMTLVLGISLTTAFADSTYSITIKSTTEGHTYGAYQIFTGDISGSEGNYVLSNIEWGDSIITDNLSGISINSASIADLTAAEVSELLTSGELANQFAIDLVEAGALSSTAYATTSEIDESASGYVISDLEPGYYLIKDEDTVSGNDAATAYIIEVVGDTTATPKSDVPTVEKTVLTEDDATSANLSSSTWAAATDADANNTIWFKIAVTLPSTGFDAYETYSLVFEDSFENLTIPDSGIDYTIYIGDTALSDEQVEAIGASITYSEDSDSFTLTINDILAAVDEEGNSLAEAGGTVSVIYSMTLDSLDTGDVATNGVYIKYSNDPYSDSLGSTSPGEDEDGNPTPSTTTTVYSYTLNIDKTDESGNALEGAGFTLYKVTDDGDVEVEIIEAEEGKTTFTFTGLDSGTYKLVESETPTGYNTISDVTFTITAVFDEDGNITSLTTDNTNYVGDETGLTISATIENTTGFTLPTTGDFGTMLFYVAGIGLIAGSIYMLRKRKLAEDSDTEE